MLIGYARVSTDDQDTAAQVRALKAAECEKIYRGRHPVAAGTGRNSTSFWTKSARETSLSSGSWTGFRSLRDVLNIMERLADAKAGSRSLTEAINTTTPA